jgi:F0F1-type ATP synthase assembly protein I
MGMSLLAVQVSLEPGVFGRETRPEEQVKRPGGDEPGKERQPASLGDAYRKAAPYTSAATSLVVAVAGLTLLGYWLDQKVGNKQTPWFTLGGALVGMVGGFVSFFRQVLGKGSGR